MQRPVPASYFGPLKVHLPGGLIVVGEPEKCLSSLLVVVLQPGLPADRKVPAKLVITGVLPHNTLLYLSLCWNDAETDQHKEPMRDTKDYLDGQIASVGGVDS